MRHLAHFLTAAAAALGLAVVAGFAVFVGVAHRSNPPPSQADGIVVLTGGPDRVDTGLHLLVAGRARVLLVSGVAHGAGLAEMLHRAGLQEGPADARITLGRSATTTLGNAEETAEWVRANQLRSLIVVTAGFHMPRALLELGRAMPQVALYPVPVQPQAAGHLGSVRSLATEYVKLVGAWLGVSRVVAQPLSAVSQDPVGKSVNG